jgi:hypothetical protein
MAAHGRSGPVTPGHNKIGPHPVHAGEGPILVVTVMVPPAGFDKDGTASDQGFGRGVLVVDASLEL